MRLTFPIHARLPVPERLVLRRGRWGRTPLAVRYGLFERVGHGAVLIDAGWAEARLGDSLPLRLYDRTMPVRIDREQDPLHILPDRVLLSHLHADHVGALRDLPVSVQIHVDAAAWGRARRGGWATLRHAVFPELLPDRAVFDIAGARELTLPFGLGRGTDVLGDGSVLSVPLPGHADGHTGFLFPGFSPPVLYAADVQWVLAGLDPGRSPSWPLNRVYSDPNAVPKTLSLLRSFRERGGTIVLNHDPNPIGPFLA